MARVPVSRDPARPREWGRRAAFGAALLMCATRLAFASDASPGSAPPERARLTTSAFALPSVSPAQRHHLGLDGAWELSHAREAADAAARVRPGATALRSRVEALEAVTGPSVRSAEDSRWWDGFGLPGLNSIVHSLVEFDGALVAGGEFTLAGGKAVAHVARWTGTTWAPMGDGLNGPVYALAVYDGHLIAGGEFWSSGETRTGPLAQWDGQKWLGLAAGSGGCVHALAPYGASLAAGGCFWIGSDIQNVGLWNGQDWSRLGDGVDGHVFALATYRGELIAGGAFTASGSVPALRVAHWTGTSWQPMGDGIDGEQSPAVQTLVVVGDALIAGGWFTRAGGAPAGSIARWDGAAWSPIPGAPDGDYDALLADGDGFLAAGFLTGPSDYPISIARWSAGAWSEAAEPLWGVRALAHHDGTLFIGGYFQQAMPILTLGRPVPWIGRLDGDKWAELESMGPGTNGLTLGGASAFQTFRGQLIAGGQFDDAASPSGWVSAYGVARWDGSRWQRMGDSMGDVAAAAEYQGDLLVAGNFVVWDGGTRASGVVRWDGAHWSSMNADCSIVRSLAIYRGELYASGAFYQAGGQLQEGVFRWNGTSWSPVGAAFDWVPYETWVSVLHVHGDLLLAGGQFRGVAGLDSPNLVAWDGETWRSLGMPFGGEVRSLATYQDRLYAGGAGASSLAWMADSEWHPIDAGFCSGVNAMEVVDGSLYIGGQFSAVEGVPARNIARWDGTTWEALGSGVDDQVWGIGVNGRDLYAGGWFSAAGGKPSYGIARWSLGPELSRPPLVLPSAAEVHVGPNPARAEATISYRLPEAGDASITVHDLSGRLVATLVKHSVSAGEHQWTWRPSDGRMAPGLYLVRVTSRGRVASTKMVWAP